MNDPEQKRVLAVAAHPDDIEFLMAGTLLRLRDTGVEIHMWNLANGCCGSNVINGQEVALIRQEEARASAAFACAVIHPPLTEDIDIFYEKQMIMKAAAVIRKVKPAIILLPSPQDYMEDHQNTCRIIVTAAFVRNMRNYVTSPLEEPWSGQTALYHAMPHGLRDSLRKRVKPGQYVDIGSVLEQKRNMLSMHKSQQEWLDHSQGIGTYLSLMVSMSGEVGILSGRFEFAEGWRRHSHFGFGAPEYDPLSELLTSACWTDPAYEHSLDI